ncbi:Putative ring-cleaving dioxygenase mhqO [Acholeplasma oculi]|uniref:Glyoxalase/Bleomycin resistance protein/Dioxygenase superfamily protein n=1 Tax=Acholeplasma oculi TaxID=35623 RepID=A0A061AA46_9MOLU|nr:VOC family protein [Acholeplasma oculi]CDR30775.1 Glyoxalase/Bleomycin resistance protein/Dioxygenase superfamily protein [Acholeplasma oculi]SKC34931.1 glyoxalase family protein [Acholeplasma oculi]SUT89713.1 Putative ring-cleaving dioxygenase mhqO [Acholeplasma oculi]
MHDIIGIHHITAITSSAPKIYQFFTDILGIRLVKKTVNQDDIDTYHLFFSDDLGSPGTDMTFFDFKGIQPAYHANNEVSRSGFRVLNDEALAYWIKRLNHFNVKHEGIKTLFGRKYINFYDFDQQPYAIFSDENLEGVKPGVPWLKGPVPNEFAIYGLGPVFLRVNQLEYIKNILESVLQFKWIEKNGSFHLFETGLGGNGASIIVEENLILPNSRQGFGGVHHIAFRVPNKASIHYWEDLLSDMGYTHSGYVDRFYFESLYTRLYPGILFEFATEGPGFINDEETYENLGETLALPPRFKQNRAYVESVVKQFDTVRSNKTYRKEYL